MNNLNVDLMKTNDIELIKSGDEVFEISNPSIIMRVESIQQDLAVCSVKDLMTFSKHFDTYSQQVLRKVRDERMSQYSRK